MHHRRSVQLLIIFTFVVITLMPASGQSGTSLFVGVYSGSYAMKDYKGIQQSIATSGSHDLHKNFSSSIGYQLELSWLSHHNRFGFYGDYSQAKSSEGTDESMTAKHYTFGVLDYVDIGSHFSMGLRLGFNYSTLDTENLSYRGGNFQAIHNPSFFSSGVDFEPFFAWIHPFKSGDLRLGVGYDINSQATSYYSKNSDIAMRTENQKEAKADWSGLRLNLAYGFHLGKGWNK